MSRKSKKIAQPVHPAAAPVNLALEIKLLRNAARVAPNNPQLGLDFMEKCFNFFMAYGLALEDLVTEALKPTTEEKKNESKPTP